jgi:hypothetical protein
VLQDTKAPGTWFRNGKIITSMPGGKFETQSRNGVHWLKISKMDMTEGDTYQIETGGLQGSCVVTVLEAEKKPVLNWKPKTIEAEVGKPEVIKIPFTSRWELFSSICFLVSSSQGNSSRRSETGAIPKRCRNRSER